MLSWISSIKCWEWIAKKIKSFWQLMTIFKMSQNDWSIFKKAHSDANNGPNVLIFWQSFLNILYFICRKAFFEKFIKYTSYSPETGQFSPEMAKNRLVRTWTLCCNYGVLIMRQSIVWNSNKWPNESLKLDQGRMCGSCVNFHSV